MEALRGGGALCVIFHPKQVGRLERPCTIRGGAGQGGRGRRGSRVHPQGAEGGGAMRVKVWDLEGWGQRRPMVAVMAQAGRRYVTSTAC